MDPWKFHTPPGAPPCARARQPSEGPPWRSYSSRRVKQWSLVDEPIPDSSMYARCIMMFPMLFTHSKFLCLCTRMRCKDGRLMYCKKMVCSLTGNGQCWFFGTWMTFGWGYIQYGWTVFVFVSIWCCRLNLLYKHSKKFLQSPRILFTHAVCVCVQISRMIRLLQFM